jgi:hypothetical protein
MSIRAIAWVLEQEIKKPLEKYVRVILSNYAGYTGMVYPSTETISLITGLSRSSVIRLLDRLVAQCWLEDTGKRTGRTKQIKVYRLKSDSQTPFKSDLQTPFKPERVSPSTERVSPSTERVSPSYSDPLEEPYKEPKSTKLSEVIEILKEDPRYDGLDIDLELEKAVAWRRKKNMGVSERFLRYWLDNADRDLEGDDDEELYHSEPYYSWEGWTEERRRALRELWPGAAEPPQRWDTLSRNLQEMIEARVKEGWSA